MPKYLLHGTSDANLNNIMIKGLKNPYLTDLYQKAEYYAIEASEDQNSIGNPIILKIKIPNTKNLITDFNELDEPVVVDGMENFETINKKIQDEYKKYLKQFPDTYNKKTKIINVNPKDYYVSLNTVHSVQYNGTINPKFIEVI